MSVGCRFFAATLWAAAGSGYLAAQVSNTYVYNEITSLTSPGADSYNYPLISRSANRIVFTQTVSGNPGTNTLWVVNPDGTGLAQIDSDTASVAHYLGISDDGSKALIWTPGKIRLVNTNGSGAQTLVTVDANGISQARITGDGSKVIFANNVNENLTLGGTTPIAQGIYEVSPSGGTPQAVVTATALISYLNASSGIRSLGGLNSLDVSMSGSQVVVAVNTVLQGQFLMAANGDGTGLHTLFGPIPSVFTTGISEDGSTVWYNCVFMSLAPNEIGVVPFAGGSRTALTTGGNDSGGIATDLQLTANGSKLLYGDNGTGMLFNTNGSGAIPLFITTQGISGPLIATTSALLLTMDATGTNFAFTEPERNSFPGIEEIGVLTLNPSSEGSAPAITNPAANPPYIVINGGSSSTVSATVTAATAIGAASAQIYLPTTAALGSGSTELAAGANNLYSGSMEGGYDKATGTRTVRIQAETTGSNGRRHATAVDFGPFSVVTTPPATTTVTTAPPGLPITVDGTVYIAPQQFLWTAGSSHTISVTSLETLGSVKYAFASWSDGGALSHTVTAQSASTTFTATFTVFTVSGPFLTITKSHTASFVLGGVGYIYTITVTNSGTLPTAGMVTVTDTLPTGMLVESVSSFSTGWSCTSSLPVTCTRSDPLAVGASYPPITLTVGVTSTAPASVTNTATVTGGGSTNTVTNTASDITAIGAGTDCASSFVGAWDFATIAVNPDGFLTTVLEGWPTTTDGYVIGNVLFTPYYKLRIAPDGSYLIQDAGYENPDPRWSGNAPVACPYTSSPLQWLGEWITTPFGRVLITMNQNGTLTITVPPGCTYAGATFTGTLTGLVLTGTYSSPSGGPPSGTFSVTFVESVPLVSAGDGYAFSGTYTPTGGASVPFSGATASQDGSALVEKTANIVDWDWGSQSNGFGGRWNTPYGLLTLQVNAGNNTVSGTYPSGGSSSGGSITGTVSASSGFGPPNFGADTTLTGTYADATGTGSVSWIIDSNALGVFFHGMSSSYPWVGGRASNWLGTWNTNLGNAVFEKGASIGLTNPDDLSYGGDQVIGTLGSYSFAFSIVGTLLSQSPVSGQVFPGAGQGSFSMNADGLSFTGGYFQPSGSFASVSGTYVSNSLAGLNLCATTLSPFVGTFSTPLGTMTVTESSNGTLTGTIPGGPTFTGALNGFTWSGGYNGPSGSGTFNFTSNGYTFSGYAVSTNGTPTAFTATPGTSTTPTSIIQTIPPGLQVQVDNSTLTAPQNVTWTSGSSHTIGVASPQGSGTTQYGFSNWSDSGAESHSVVGPSLATTYTAYFTTQYQLTVTAGTGGTASPTGGFYNSGTGVTIGAAPAPGYAFTGWTGSGQGSYTGTNNPASIDMNGPITETANFAALTPVAVTTNPPGLAMVVDGVTLTAPQGFVWAAGTSHSIGVTSPEGSGGTQNAFSSWSDGGAQTHTVTAPASAAVYTASFTTQYLLSVAISPSAGGTVSASPASASGYYNAGTAVQLTAAGNSGFVFIGWSGDLTGSANPQSIAMSAPHNVTANFASVSTAGLGYYPMTPCRLVDTRAGSDKSGAFGSPSMGGGSTRSFPLLSGRCGIPSTAQAYALNITAAPAGGGLGYLTTWPTGSAQPVVSTLNSSDGAVTANAAIVPAGGGPSGPERSASS